ncbi:hypothetical protein GLYMA_20G118800v4 [Glycine max]|uniref:Uncharacterized protein n=1 Tax=Glycine max TaxID=3847 RepID=K7N2Z2_SOYBN|nr:hypothetical protein GLYMA_20G118800v4 [Glycine max]
MNLLLPSKEWLFIICIYQIIATLCTYFPHRDITTYEYHPSQSLFQRLIPCHTISTCKVFCT